MSEQDTLVRWVRDALAHLYDPVHLQSHPLTDLLDLPMESGESSGECLRRILWDSIEQLRPKQSLPQGGPEWINYRLLWLHYAQTVDQAATCRDLGISQRSFYRYRSIGIDAIASMLCEKYRRRTNRTSGSKSNDPILREPEIVVTEEAVRLASRSPRGRVGLSRVLQEALQTVHALAEQRSISLTVSEPSDLPSINGDPAVLHQILLNVLAEGIKHTTKTALVLDIEISTKLTTWRLRGLGHQMAPGDALWRSGGLAVSKALLQVYNGCLWLERDAHRHPVICFSLPLETNQTVLIIDDNYDTILLYRRYLERHQYLVRAARNREEMLQELAEIKPDIILLDVLMPQQDGWGVLKWIKEQRELASIPVIICSVIDQTQLAKSLGAAHVLHKPITEAALLRALQEVLYELDNAV